MPIPIQLQPPPALERSLVPYVVTNFNMVRDALLRAFGGDYQTGLQVINFTAAASSNFGMSYPVPFTTAFGPVLMANVVNLPGPPFISCRVIANTNTGFGLIFESLSGAISGNFDFRWVAWYP